MTTSTLLYPLLRAIRHALEEALPEWNVTLGPANITDQGDYLEVGVGSPRPTEPEQAGAGEHEWKTTARARDENGTIHLVLSSWVNDSDPDVPMTRVQEAHDAIVRAIAADPRWAVDGVLRTGVQSQALTLGADGYQSSAELFVVLGYEARINR